MVARLDNYNPGTLSEDPAGSRDLVKKLYQQLFPKSVRHDLGEYYTPDWLAEHVLNELGYIGDPDKRLLDPACGSGTFLVMAINRIRGWYDENRERCRFGEDDLCRKILANVIGFDLNPLAVMAARTNYLIAIRDLIGHVDRIEIPIYLCDSIMTPSEHGGLFTGALGKAKELKTAPTTFIIPTEIATNREDVGKYAEQLEFCVRNSEEPRSKLRGIGSTESTRTKQASGNVSRSDSFKLPSGRFFKVLCVYDFSSFQPFEGATNRTATIIMELSDSPTHYPVAYNRVHLRKSDAASEERRIANEPSFSIDRLEASPISKEITSPWLVAPRGIASTVSNVLGESPYMARIGAHSGGAAGVFWIDVLKRDKKQILITNRWDVGRNKFPSVTRAVEPQLVRPLVRGRDVDRWVVKPSTHIVIPYDVENHGKAISESRMRREFPKTFEYFEQFKSSLIEKPHYIQHFQPAGQPYWSMYNVGNYTFAPSSVVWPEQTSTFKCAVLEGDSHLRPVADHKLIVTVCSSSEEAHYLAAVLNSAPARLAIDSYVVKVQVSTHVLKNIAIPRFAKENALHRSLAEQSLICHRETESGHWDKVREAEEKIDGLVGRLWKLSPSDVQRIQHYVHTLAGGKESAE